MVAVALRAKRAPSHSQNEEFKKAFREHRESCDWLSWMGNPMIYDGALFVERDYLTSAQHERVRQAHLHDASRTAS